MQKIKHCPLRIFFRQFFFHTALYFFFHLISHKKIITFQKYSIRNIFFFFLLWIAKEIDKSHVFLISFSPVPRHAPSPPHPPPIPPPPHPSTSLHLGRLYLPPLPALYCEITTKKKMLLGGTVIKELRINLCKQAGAKKAQKIVRE